MMPRDVVDKWGACPEGEIQRMVSQIQRNRRRQAVTQAASVGAVLLLAVTAAATFFAFRPADPHGGLACAEVLQYLPAYRAGRTGADLSGRIATHLKNCAYCRLQNEKSIKRSPSRDQAQRVPLSAEIVLPGAGTTSGGTNLVTFALRIGSEPSGTSGT